MAELLKDAQIDALFPTPIMRLRWDEAAARNPRLVETILAKEKADPGIDRSNKGGWHSDNDIAKWGGDAALALLKFAVAAAGKATKQVMMGQAMEAFQWQAIMWANVNRSGDYNAAHILDGADGRIAPGTLFKTIQDHMVGHYQMSTFADLQTADVHASGM